MTEFTYGCIIPIYWKKKRRRTQQYYQTPQYSV